MHAQTALVFGFAAIVASQAVGQNPDGQAAGQSATPVSQLTDGQPNGPSAVSQISDGQPQAPPATPAPVPSPSTTPAVVSEKTEGQPVFTTAPSVAPVPTANGTFTPVVPTTPAPIQTGAAALFGWSAELAGVAGVAALAALL